MIVGILVGIGFMVLLILAFAAGYGWDKSGSNTEDE